MSVILVNTPLFWGIGDSAIPLFQVSKMFNNNYFEGLETLPGEQLGLASIQAYCRKKDVDVQVIDGIALEHKSCEQTFELIEDIAKTKGNPVLIGFSGTCVAFKATLKLATMCKTKWESVRIIHGYEFGTLNAAHILENYPVFDFVGLGDGEEIIASLAEKLSNGHPYEDVLGLAWRDSEGEVRKNATNPMDIDSIPWATRESAPLIKKLGFAMSVFTSRGCPFRCSYCTTGDASALNGKARYRVKSAENVVEEMLYLQKTYDLEHITLVDDNFLTKAGSSKQRVRELAELLIKRQSKVGFMIDARLDVIERDLFELLHRAGLRKVFVGIETPNEDQLKTYSKTYNIGSDTPLSRLKILNELGIKIHPGVIMYHPTVTPKEMRATADIIHQIGWKSPESFCNRMKLYPGTRLYEEYERKGWTVGQWPTKDWEFVDSRAKHVANEMLSASLYTKTDNADKYDQVRAKFLSLIDAWEKGEQMSIAHQEQQLDSAALQRSGSA